MFIEENFQWTGREILIKFSFSGDSERNKKTKGPTFIKKELDVPSLK